VDDDDKTMGSPYRELSGPAYRGEFTDQYNALRPKPPGELFELLTSLAPSRPPALVVDLGAGTGISTAPWSMYAERAIGIEINPEMSRHSLPATNVEYRSAPAQKTGLPDACADVVTCAQSFHWMPFELTVREVCRLLKPGGIFAAYDYDWPPTISWEVDTAFLRVIEASGVDPARPEKADHLRLLNESGGFQEVREVFLHKREVASADHVARLPLVFGPIARRLNEGASPELLGLSRLRQVIDETLQAEGNVLWWGYRLRIART
jgi:SAM-dependent methyltransferase